MDLIITFNHFKVIFHGYRNWVEHDVGEPISSGVMVVSTPMGNVNIMAADWEGHLWVCNDDNDMYHIEWDGGGSRHEHISAYADDRATWFMDDSD